MKIQTSIFRSFLIFLCILCTSPFAPAQTAKHKLDARRILDATNVKGGLVVLLGCGERKLQPFAVKMNFLGVPLKMASKST